MKLLRNRTVQFLTLALAITIAGIALTNVAFGKHGSRYGRCFDTAGQQMDCK